MSALRTPAAALMLALALAAAPAVAQEIPDAEARLRSDVAKEIVAFAAACAKAGAKAAGEEAAEEARGLDHLADGIKAAEDALAALASDAPDAAALAAARTAAGKSVAKAYDRLAALKHDGKDEARFLGYFARALAWEPADARVRKAAAAAEAAASKPWEGGLLLRAVLRADTDGKGKYDALVERMAKKGLLLLGSPDRDLFAFVSLPGDWKKGRSWPVLVAVDGAGCGFEACGRAFAGSRGSRPFIVVSPVTLSNTNELQAASYPCYPKSLLTKWNGNRFEFDGPGVDAVLAEVRKRFGGEEKVFITGFSGGGNWCYGKLMRDPKGVRGAAPACANFSGMGSDGAPGAGEGGGPPVHILTGEKDEHREFTFGKKDSPGIEPQTDRAVEVLKGLGYTNVRRTMVKGAGHSALHAEVWKFVDEVMGAK